MLARLSPFIVFFAVCAVGSLTACQPPTPRLIVEETSTAAPLPPPPQPVVVASAEDAQVAGGEVSEGIVLDEDDAARIDAANANAVADRPAVVDQRARAAEVSTTGSASTYSSGYGFNVMPSGATPTPSSTVALAPTSRITASGTTAPLQQAPRRATGSTTLTPGSTPADAPNTADTTAEMVDGAGAARAAEVMDAPADVGAPYIDPAALSRINAMNDAVSMGQLAAQRATRPELRAFAADMNGYGPTLQQQLSTAGVGTLAPSTSATELGNVNGDNFDRLYLESMIRHHEHALANSSDARETAQLQRELGQLQGWYATWY